MLERIIMEASLGLMRDLPVPTHTVECGMAMEHADAACICKSKSVHIAKQNLINYSAFALNEIPRLTLRVDELLRANNDLVERVRNAEARCGELPVRADTDADTVKLLHELRAWFFQMVTDSGDLEFVNSDAGQAREPEWEARLSVLLTRLGELP